MEDSREIAEDLWSIPPKCGSRRRIDVLAIKQLEYARLERPIDPG